MIRHEIGEFTVTMDDTTEMIKAETKGAAAYVWPGPHSLVLAMLMEIDELKKRITNAENATLCCVVSAPDLLTDALRPVLDSLSPEPLK